VSVRGEEGEGRSRAAGARGKAEDGEAAPRRRERKVPKKPSETGLFNAAVYYLQRYAASVAMLRRFLERRVKRAERAHATTWPEAAAWTERAIARLTAAGALDDTRLAEAKTASLRRAGKSTRMISLKLRQKGFAPALISQSAGDGKAADVEAIETFARKKKLGRYRPEAQRKEKRQKDLAALMRAGYAYGLAKTLL
jgi:regulatory protein